MEVHPWTLSARSAYRRLQRGEIDPAPEYQRGRVWSRRKKSLLIDSMLRGYDLPKFFLHDVDSGPHEVIDGQQRLDAISAFFSNEVRLPKESGQLSGKTYDTLPTDVADCLDDYQLTFSLVTKADDAAIREMFLRLQMGVKLNAAEELNAIAGGMHDYIENLAAKPFFTRTVAFSNNRGAHRHVAAQLARLTVQGFGDVRKSDLLDLYRARSSWIPDDNGLRLRRTIDWLENVFDDKDVALRNRGQVVSMVYAIYSLQNDLVFRGFEPQVHDCLRKLDESHVSDDARFADYRVALAHSSDQRRSLEIRHKYILAAIAEHAGMLPRKDPQRVLSPDERAAVYYRDGGCCQHANCGRKVDFGSFHADHVLAWSRGGQTTLDNIQVLCPEHNLAKGAR